MNDNAAPKWLFSQRTEYQPFLRKQRVNNPFQSYFAGTKVVFHRRWCNVHGCTMCFMIQRFRKNVPNFQWERNKNGFTQISENTVEKRLLFLRERSLKIRIQNVDIWINWNFVFIELFFLYSFDRYITFSIRLLKSRNFYHIRKITVTADVTTKKS